MKQIKNRDPKPVNRDPQIEPAKEITVKPKLICVTEVPAYCPQCKSGLSRITATRPEEHRGLIVKYRSCLACGCKFASSAIVPQSSIYEPVDGID